MVGSTDDIDGGPKSRPRARLTHQIDNRFEGVKQAARAGPTDVRKEAAFDRVILAAVARQVSDSDRHTNRIAQLLKVVLEQVTVRGIASSAIAQQQDTRPMLM